MFLLIFFKFSLNLNDFEGMLKQQCFSMQPSKLVRFYVNHILSQNIEANPIRVHAAIETIKL